ncbi:MAG: putative lipid II flippase FtsW [Proteobacteria bacterium]|nr:putative lipid II flippase FtsW [Pseudomonadota bacterium]
MRTTFIRRDNSLIGRWWWTIDRWSLMAVLALIAVGILMSFAASPPVANRLNLEAFFFVKRHLVMTIPAVFLIFVVSLLTPIQVRRFATIGFLVCLCLLTLTLFYGVEIKGAKRWLNLAGNSIQASEFMKPFFAIMTAWMFAEKAKKSNFPGVLISFFLMTCIVGLLMMQPDLGMTVVIVFTWCVQLFLSGIPFIWIGIVFGAAIVGLMGAYMFFPHVTKRIDQFLDPVSGDTKQELYQITQSLEAFMNGGLFGKGPGEGIVKKHIPDAHADFVFAVTGEEFGFIVCSIIVLLFLFIIVRSLLRTMEDSSIFIVLGTCSLAAQFALQTFVNMASTLHLIPTKGMTMPFISYGGSSQIALGISMGMLLAFTRERHGQMEY